MGITVLIARYIGAKKVEQIGELLGGKKSMEAFKAGIGAFVGFLLSVVVKMALCGYFVYCFISALI